jgi:hypothetical protein
MPIIYSKKEYLGLTENGYKEATRVDANAHNARSAEDAGKTIIRGDQYINYAHAGAMGHRAKGTINYQQQWSEIENGTNLNTLASELEQLRKQLQLKASSRLDIQLLGLVAEAEEHAENQGGSKVMPG